MKIFFFLLLITFSYLTIFSNNITSYLEKYPLEEGEYLAFIFINPSSCIKCTIYPEQLILNTIRRTKKKIKIIGVIYCNRLIELKSFKKEFNWKYDIEPDLRNGVRKSIGCKMDTDICIINHLGEIISELKLSDEFDENLKALVDKLSP